VPPSIACTQTRRRSAAATDEAARPEFAVGGEWAGIWA
jgi:hypothetical protein